MLLTDGKDPNSLSQTSRTLRNKGVTIFMVGVGDGVSDRQLLGVTGDRQNYFKITKFTDLVSVTDEIIPASCRGR